ncbi:MAG: uroporphyrinogen decarboxylase family protein, partial [Armatimonadota bacterium]|nr:uroporphyrinogen decarboxylase family protein [Armatimonadota bacterium]
MTDRERFIACMEYQPADRRPNHELGVWGQTRERWLREAPGAVASFGWNWFWGEDALGLDRRDYIPVNYGFIPPFPTEVLQENERTIVARNAKGIVTRALKVGTVGGTRPCMDEYLDFPVKRPEDFPAIKKRLVAAIPQRYPPNLHERIAAWQNRECVLVLGTNCAANGFYWRAREFMGTEALSYAWYDYPALMHEMMEFFADFIIETSRPVLQKISVDYFVLNEDLSMKAGPLLSPATFREFIFPHLKRMVAFFRQHGTRYFAIDTDGDPTVLIPLFLEAGVDTLWPIERAADISPMGLRRRFGRSLRLWGGVDKRVLPRGPHAIRAHLREFIPLIEEGGFIPTVDHTVP